MRMFAEINQCLMASLLCYAGKDPVFIVGCSQDYDGRLLHKLAIRIVKVFFPGSQWVDSFSFFSEKLHSGVQAIAEISLGLKAGSPQFFHSGHPP
jgi:hypothetical protein